MGRMEAKRAANHGVEPSEPAASQAREDSTAAAEPETPEPGSANATAPPPAKRRGPSAPTVVLLVLVGVLVVGAGALVWWVYGTTWLARDAAATTVTELRDAWAATPSATAAPEGEDPDDQPAVPAPARPAPGEAAWILSIPAIDLETPILAGVEPDQLTQGVGWYQETALPGQVGNTALAGLRITHGEPFSRLLELEVGDEVLIETADAVFTYEIIGAPADLTVQADESWVLDPVPGEPDTVPSRAILTLTTEEDLITTPDRSVGFGTLQKAEVK